MELWIRSQNRSQLAKITGVLLLDKEIRGFTNTNYFYELGIYKTKKRALEVLDEIQSKLKATFLMKLKDEKFSKYVEDCKRYSEDLNGICVVTGDRCFDLEPINKDIDVYEMPKE